MKIEKKQLIDFLKKIKMNNSQQIDEILFKFEKEGLTVKATSPTKVCMVIGKLDKKGFVEYDEIGTIGINELATFVRVADRFTKEIEIKVEGNLMTLSEGTKSLSVELVSEKFIQEEGNIPELQHDETFKIKAVDLSNIFKDVALNRDAALIVETVKGGVIFSNTGKYKFKTQFEAPDCKGGVKVRFGQPFVDALSSLDGVLDCHIKTDYPIRVIETTSNTEIEFIIAPRVEND